MDETISSAKLQRLLNINSAALSTLAAEGVVVRAEKRGTYVLEPSVRGYIARLQVAARGRGGEDAATARARLGAAQATLAEVKARQLSGELVEVAEVEAKWSATCRAIRSRVLAVADRMRDLPARQQVKLARELREALTELSNGKA